MFTNGAFLTCTRLQANKDTGYYEGKVGGSSHLTTTKEGILVHTKEYVAQLLQRNADILNDNSQVLIYNVECRGPITKQEELYFYGNGSSSWAKTK